MAPWIATSLAMNHFEAQTDRAGLVNRTERADVGWFMVKLLLV